MKKLLGIVVLGLLWCNVGFSITYDWEKILENCTNNGKWTCKQEKIDEYHNNLKRSGKFLDDCSSVRYRAPCTCEREESYAKRKYCEIKMKPVIVKKSRMEAADYCSRLSEEKVSEVREEYFKSCMKDEGF